MTNYYEIVAAFLVAVLVTVFFSAVLGSKGPWGALWLVFVTIFFATWAAHLWISPFGPMILGVSVVPVLVVGLIFAFILAATTLPAPGKKNTPPQDARVANEEAPVNVIGIFFWVVLIILLFAIAAGYYRMPVNTQQLVK
jgi:hypothetical protein